VRIKVAPTLVAEERCPGNVPRAVGECMAWVEPLAKRTTLARRADELSVEGFRSFLFSREDALMSFDSCQGDLWVQLHVRHELEVSTSSGASQ
jgi:hypothetical protein